MSFLDDVKEFFMLICYTWKNDEFYIMPLLLQAPRDKIMTPTLTTTTRINIIGTTTNINFGIQVTMNEYSTSGSWLE